MLQIILLILNICDYILTVINMNNFEEGNPLMNLILDNTVLLTIIKLVVAPVLIYILWRNRNLKVAKIGTIILCVFYTYAVIIGFLYASLKF